MTQPTPREPSEHAAEALVTQQVTEMNATVAQLASLTTELTQRQEGQLRRLRKLLLWTVLGLVLDLLLTVLGAVLVKQTQDNTHAIDTVQSRTSTQALCPLYDLFLRSYNPNNAIAKQDPVAYDKNFEVIEKGAAALQCPHTKRGPA